MSLFKTVSAVALLLALGTAPALADKAAAKKWIDSEFQPSTLSKEDQMKEMEWFIKAAKPFKGMEINTVAEAIPTHDYESKVLAKAFEEITGIKVNHQIIGEGDLVQAIQTQLQTNRNLYDAYVNDSDLIGMHMRLGLTVNLTDWMAGEADVGIPNGRPVDEWGIRMEKDSCNPAGASVSRGGGTNSPAAIYAVAKWDEWLRKYAPPGAADLDFYQSLPALSQGNVAQ